MIAKNMDQLEAMLLWEMEKAMGEASEQMLQDTQTETAKFYTIGGGPDQQYKRTHKLENSPRVSGLSKAVNEISFDVYLETNADGYTTGTFSKLEVLKRAEATSNRAGIKGKPQFWKNSEKKFDKTLSRTMKKHFK